MSEINHPGQFEGRLRRLGKRPDWAARRKEWDTRVETLGVDKAVFHLRHRTPEALAAITKLQEETIWPIFVNQVNQLPREVTVDKSGFASEGILTCLDFGCGIGRWTLKLAGFCGMAFGIDPTVQFLRYAKKNNPLMPNCGDYLLYKNGRIPLIDNCVDVVWACMVLSTVLDDEMLAATITEIDRVLKPGGLMFLVDNTWGHGKPVRSRWSMSRTVAEYQAAFAQVAPLIEYGHYVDLGETNTVMAGLKFQGVQ
jgi:SAM-dependent methyltransferase